MEVKCKGVNKRIKSARIKTGLTQAEFGAAAGLNQPFIALIESEKRRPSMAVCIAIAYKHGINEEWLLTGRCKRKKC